MGSALRLSGVYMQQARRDGDARLAGRALAVLRPWGEPSSTPDAVLLELASVQQYLHDFDGALANLRILVSRSPDDAQAWLTIATLLRVQGEYDSSDAACERLSKQRAALYRDACLSENASLRGKFAHSRSALQAVLRQTVAPEVRNWLLTTLAENELRAGRAASAERAFRQALDEARDGYTLLSFSDFLLDHDQPAEALALLRGEPRSDTVLLRIALAETRLRSADAAATVRELADRMQLAALRPEARVAHAREQAMFVSELGAGACAAVDLARVNVRHQREPLDLLLFMRVARSCGDPAAQQEAEAAIAAVGLRDARIDALR